MNKRIVAAFSAIILINSGFCTGCSSSGVNANEPKQAYNVAYISTAFGMQSYFPASTSLKENGKDYASNDHDRCISRLITDWKYCENDTIQITCTDGTIFQTAASNICLVYDPTIE